MMFLRQEDFATVVRSTPLVSLDFIVENSRGEFLLGKRTNRPAQGYWFVPGGRVQKDETLEAAFERLTMAELLGGSPGQVCIAAEIAMEHNLGLTCDPVAGQVQVPCIERNAIAAVKAVNAARMALRRTSEPRVCLDKVIETMYETGKDMNAKYRETSRGGLAMKIVACD